MNCIACKQPNTPERNYCGSCGTPLARYCALCGFRNGAADRFCGGCGASVGAAPGARAEARPGTVTPGLAPSAAAATPAPGTGSAGLADLLQAAKESVEAAAAESDVKVSQDDIDNLFGE